jgi:hypothetical protein
MSRACTIVVSRVTTHAQTNPIAEPTVIVVMPLVGWGAERLYKDIVTFKTVAATVRATGSRLFSPSDRLPLRWGHADRQHWGENAVLVLVDELAEYLCRSAVLAAAPRFGANRGSAPRWHMSCSL